MLQAIAEPVFSNIRTNDLCCADQLIDEILGDTLMVKAAPEDPLLVGFRTRYTAALDGILKGQFDRFDAADLKADIDEMMDFAEEAFGPEVVKKLHPATQKYLKQAFVAGQAVRGIGGKVSDIFNKPRQEALDWLVEHDGFWIGRVFPEHLSGDFRNTITQGLREGLGRKDIGNRLRRMVLGKPGLPTKQDYYTRIAATSINRANNWGGVFSLHEAGYTEYTIRAVRDERTSAICRLMNRKVFQVQDAMNMVQRAITSAPSAIEQIAPFPKYDVKQKDHYLAVNGSRHYLSNKSSKWLAQQGLSLPPYHPSCRTIYIVSKIQAKEHEEVVQSANRSINVMARSLEDAADKLLAKSKYHNSALGT